MSLKIIFIIVFSCIGVQFAYAQKDYTFLQTINKETKKPIENMLCIYYKGNKPIFRDESDFNGFALTPPIYEFDSVIFYNLEYERTKMNSFSMSDVVYIAPKPPMKEIYVTGSVVPGSKFNSSFAVKVVSEQEIKQKAANTLSDALRSENAVRLIQDPVLGTRLSILGFQPKDVKILVDGVPMIGKQNGSVDASQISMSNIERIETVEGALAVIYGTNANGGVINLITKKKNTDNWNISVQSYIETIGQFNQSISLGTKLKKHQLNLSAGRNVFLGWDPKKDSFQFWPQPQRDFLWNPKEQYFLNFSYYLPVTKNHSFRVKGDAFKENMLNRLNPNSPFSPVAIDDWYRTNRFSMAMSYSGRFNHDVNFESNAAYLSYHRTFEEFYKYLDVGNLQLLQTTDDYLSTVFNRSWVSYQPFNGKLKITGGYEFNYDYAKGVRIKSNAQNMYDIGLMSIITFKPHKDYSIEPGIRYSINSKFYTPIAPSVSLRFSPEKNINMRFLYSQAFVSPDIKELYFEFKDFNHNVVGNEDLKVETSTNVQMGMEIKRSKEKNTKYQYYTTLNFNYSDKKNAIELVLVNKANQEFKYMNIGRIKMLSASFNLTMNYSQVKFTLGGSFVGNSRLFDSFSVAASNFNKFYYSPEFSGSITYTEPKSKFVFSFFNKWNGPYTYTSINQTSQELELTSQKPYFFSDLTISNTLWDERIFINFGAKNLWDIKNIVQTGSGGSFHTDGTSQPLLCGRTYFVSVRLDLKSKEKKKQ